MTHAPANPCDCAECRSYCRHRPGFFAPDQIDPLAERMGLTPKELFDTFLSVDPWLADGETKETFWGILPAVIECGPGGENDYDPCGTCIFLKEERCAIHDLGKPVECAAARHDNPGTDDDHRAAHKAFVHAWNQPEHQARIRELLGREPVEPEASMDSLLSLLFG